MPRVSLFFCSLLVVGLAACNKGIEGDLKDNILPETHLVTDTIIRSGSDRLVSQIDVSWSGTDQDGYVIGYEYSLNGDTWGFTKSQDSTFLVQLPDGADTFDVDFRVRAVDNRNGVDPTPARLVYPVKNSPPTIDFVYQSGSGSSPSRNPVRTFPVLKLEWEAIDRDGEANIDRIELVINDTTASSYVISPDFSTMTIQADDPSADLSPSTVYLGSALSEQSEKIEGLVLNDTNRFFIRVIDKVGVASRFMPSRKVYVKKKESDILLVNGYSNNYEARENFYLNNLTTVGINDVDVIRVNEVEDMNLTSLAPDNPTQSRIFALYDALMWFGEDAPYLLTLAQRTTGDFLDNGGKMFVTAFFSSGIDPQSQYLDFTPIDSLVGSFFIDKGADVTSAEDGWPVLTSSKIISSARPFYEATGAVPVYDAKLVKPGGPWEGKSTIMAWKKDGGGKPQFAICSVELHRLNGSGNISEFFDKLFVQEFGL